VTNSLAEQKEVFGAVYDPESNWNHLIYIKNGLVCIQITASKVAPFLSRRSYKASEHKKVQVTFLVSLYIMHIGLLAGFLDIVPFDMIKPRLRLTKNSFFVDLRCSTILFGATKSSNSNLIFPMPPGYRVIYVIFYIDDVMLKI